MLHCQTSVPTATATAVGVQHTKTHKALLLLPLAKHNKARVQEVFLVVLQRQLLYQHVLHNMGMTSRQTRIMQNVLRWQLYPILQSTIIAGSEPIQVT